MVGALRHSQELQLKPGKIPVYITNPKLKSSSQETPGHLQAVPRLTGDKSMVPAQLWVAACQGTVLLNPLCSLLASPLGSSLLWDLVFPKSRPSSWILQHLGRWSGNETLAES